MADIIILAGAPGTGKSSTAKAIHERIKNPYFEFGWIPEFRLKGEAEITFAEEWHISFENLCLVARNYHKHGFMNVLLTDLYAGHAIRAPDEFLDLDCSLFTLYVTDEAIHRARLFDDSRTSDFRDWDRAKKDNQVNQERPIRAKETKIDNTHHGIDTVVDLILEASSKPASPGA